MKLQGFEKLTLVDKALEMWFKELQIGAPKVAVVSLQDALGRVLAEDLVAQEAIPRFDKSAMDGYALNSADSTGASQFKPATFQLTENQELTGKQAKQVWTGNPIPKGANAVVMIENTKMHEGRLEVWSQLKPGENVSKIGEDVKKGFIVAKVGARINPYHIGLAAALGYQSTESCTETENRHFSNGKRACRSGHSAFWKPHLRFKQNYDFS